MFMVFNVIFVVVTGLATAGAVTADRARDARAHDACVAQSPQGSAAYLECLRQRGVTVDQRSER